MDILVRKYVEKKANKWGFSNDIDISKEIIKRNRILFKDSYRMVWVLFLS